MKSAAIRRICALLLAALLLLPLALPAEAAGFTDVPPDAWYAEPVAWAVKRTITTGVSADRFAPDRACTRAEAVTFLWRFDGTPHGPGKKPFSDVSASSFCASAVDWAAYRGVVSGVAKNQFAPDRTCTRAQIVTMLWRFAGSPKINRSNPFRDVQKGTFYYDAVLWAVQKGITRGVSADRFHPEGDCTRAQIVTMLWRLNNITPAKKIVLIDPGHQLHANSEKEPNGPGSSIMKAKVSAGTYGYASKTAEYQLDLDVGLMLRSELECRGYRVIMTRTVNDVNLSNIDRAMIGNNANADAVVRIHANGSTNASVHGAETVCITRNNPYYPGVYAKSRALSDAVLTAFCAATGAKNRSVWETDTMTGLNWSQVPSTIIEMGYMSNQQEDLTMATAAYRQKMVQGIANGIDAYFAAQ